MNNLTSTLIIAALIFIGIIAGTANAQSASSDSAANLGALTCCCCCPLIVVLLVIILIIAIIYRLFFPSHTVVTVNTTSNANGNTAQPAPDKVYCPNCGAPVDASNNNCPQCGTKLKP
jgi:hypothetical protein